LKWFENTDKDNLLLYGKAISWMRQYSRSRKGSTFPVPGKCRTKSKGYRDYEYSLREDSGVLRAVVIGDSMIPGLGVDNKDAFAKVLEYLRLVPGLRPDR
jgi:hypothetical protein